MLRESAGAATRERHRQDAELAARAQRMAALEQIARSAAWLLTAQSESDGTNVRTKHTQRAQHVASTLVDAKKIIRAELEALGLLDGYLVNGRLRLPDPITREDVEGPHDPRVGNCDPRFLAS